MWKRILLTSPLLLQQPKWQPPSNIELVKEKENWKLKLEQKCERTSSFLLLSPEYRQTRLLSPDKLAYHTQQTLGSKDPSIQALIKHLLENSSSNSTEEIQRILAAVSLILMK
jgi:hypothetical protein